MEIFLIILAVVEAICIGVLVFIILKNGKETSRFIKQAQMIKARRIDVEDIDVNAGGNNSQAVMADAINSIKNNMQTFLEATKENVVILSDAIEVLSKGAELNQDGSSQISKNLSVVSERVGEQLNLVGECLRLIEDNGVKLSEIDQAARDIGGKLNASVESCKRGMRGIELCEGNMISVSKNLSHSEEILNDFSTRINEINEIGSFIENISDSLTLLSLNATIEAAHAGEAGKGFAIVASEMGEMADKTHESIANINSILSSIISSSEKVTECIRDSVNVFARNTKEFDSVSASFRMIDGQSAEINSRMADILTKLKAITNNSDVTRAQAGQAYKASEQIVSGTEEISEISVRTSEESSKMSENVGSLGSMLSGLKKLLRQYTTSVEPVKPTGGKKFKIGVLCILDNDFWHSVRRGVIYAKNELEALGTEVRYIPYHSWDEAKAIPSDFAQMMKEGFDGYVCPGFMAGTKGTMDKARQVGKKAYIFNCETMVPEARDAVFKPDNIEAGTTAAKEMVKTLGRDGRIVVLLGDKNVSVNKERCDSFVSYIEKVKGMKVVDIIDVDNTDEGSYKKAMEAIKKYPDINGMYITAGTPLGAARAIEASKKNIKLIVFDHSKEIFQFIRKGIIAAAIGQDPFGQGYDPIIWMYNNLMAGVRLPSTDMKCRINVVDRNNVDSLVEL